MPKGGKQISSAHDGRPVALYDYIGSRSVAVYPTHSRFKPNGGETAETRKQNHYFGPYSDEYPVKYRLQPVLTGGGCEPF